MITQCSGSLIMSDHLIDCLPACNTWNLFDSDIWGKQYQNNWRAKFEQCNIKDFHVNLGHYLRNTYLTSSRISLENRSSRKDFWSDMEFCIVDFLKTCAALSFKFENKAERLIESTNPSCDPKKKCWHKWWVEEIQSTVTRTKKESWLFYNNLDKCQS